MVPAPAGDRLPALKSMTVAIASYQRRDRLVALLRHIDAQVAGTAAAAGLDVIVIVDGSTDGSLEAVEHLDLAIPIDVRWQPNGGLVSARNAALAAAGGEIIWFLDDDLVPCPGLVARHRDEHQAPPAHLLLGPCKPMASTQAGEAWVRWWDEHYAELERTGFVDRFDRFTVANLSGPTEWFRSVGGFDASFFGYGCEDYELGVRMLGRGIVVRFDPEAAAWHDHAETEAVAIARKRSLGRNMVRVAKLHPETTAVLFPGRPDRAMRRLGRLRCRSPLALGAISRVSAFLGVRGEPLLGRYALSLRQLAAAASLAEGVAEADPALLPVVLEGRPQGQSSG
jgi:GT2 family glycosyltransferase